MKKKSLINLALLTIILMLVPASTIAQEVIDFEDLPPDTPVFDQFSGVTFPAIGHIIDEPFTGINPLLTTSSGTQALSSREPGDEFHTQPLIIEFNAPQQLVRFKAGVTGSSTNPTIEATLRAFDEDGNLVDEMGPIDLAVPSSITTEMSVSADPAAITRVELQYVGSFAEVIDDLEFSEVAPGSVDTEAPIVEILLPVDDAILTGQQFLIEASIIEETALSSVTITLFHQGSNTTTTFPVSVFSTGSPNYHFGPTYTNPLGIGSNTITVTGVDFAGNMGSDSVDVERVPVAGALQIDEELIVVPRFPGSTDLTLELEETFPDSLDGRESIDISVIDPQGISGFSSIGDIWDDPVPVTDVTLRATLFVPLGIHTVTMEARDEASGDILDTSTVLASVVPASTIECSASLVPFYQFIDADNLAAQITDSIHRRLRFENTVVSDHSDPDDDEDPDDDIGTPLSDIPDEVKFFDELTSEDDDGNPVGNGRLDVAEAIYADNDDSGDVSSGDERLKNSVTGENGSFVAANDIDAGNELTALPDNVRFSDMDGDGMLDATFPSLYDTVIIDNDNSFTISDGDRRIVDSRLHEPLVLRDPITVTYRDDPYGRGEMRVHGHFFASLGGWWGWNINFIGDLRVHFDGPIVGIEFVYTYTNVVPEATRFTRGAVEDRFRAGFVQPFQQDLAEAINKRIEDAGVSLFLQDVYINQREFGLGFCLPADELIDEFGRLINSGSLPNALYTGRVFVSYIALARTTKKGHKGPMPHLGSSRG